MKGYIAEDENMQIYYNVVFKILERHQPSLWYGIGVGRTVPVPDRRATLVSSWVYARLQDLAVVMEKGTTLLTSPVRLQQDLFHGARLHDPITEVGRCGELGSIVQAPNRAIMILPSLLKSRRTNVRLKIMSVPI